MKDKTYAQTLKSCCILKVGIYVGKLLINTILFKPEGGLFSPPPKIVRHKCNLLNSKANGNPFINFGYK